MSGTTATPRARVQSTHLGQVRGSRDFKLVKAPANSSESEGSGWSTLGSFGRDSSTSTPTATSLCCSARVCDGQWHWTRSTCACLAERRGCQRRACHRSLASRRDQVGRTGGQGLGRRLEAAVRRLGKGPTGLAADQKLFHAASPRRRISPTPLASRSSRSRTTFSSRTSSTSSPSLPSSCRAARSPRPKARRTLSPSSSSFALSSRRWDRLSSG